MERKLGPDEMSRQDRAAARRAIRITKERRLLEPYGDSVQFEELIKVSEPDKLVSEMQSRFVRLLYDQIGEAYRVAHQLPPRAPLHREDFSAAQSGIGRFSSILTLLASPDPAHGLDRYLRYLKRRSL